jgi:hypothetical protein
MPIMDRGKPRSWYRTRVVAPEPGGAAAESKGALIHFGDDLLRHPLFVRTRIRGPAPTPSGVPPTHDDNSIHTNSDLDSDFSSLPDCVDLPLSVGLYRSIDEAWDDMGGLRVDALLVTDHALAGADPQVEGLIAANDIWRARPRDKRGAVTASGRAPLLVRDVMTPLQDLPYVNCDSMITLAETDLFEMLQGTALKHVLVVQTGRAERIEALGILSRETLAERLADDKARHR